MLKSDLVILQLFRRLTNEQKDALLDFAKCMVQPIFTETPTEKETNDER